METFRYINAPQITVDIPGLRRFKKGKVREIFDCDDRLLIVATDRISAFDHILPNGIPLKGVVLNQLSLFWFDDTADIVRNHLLSADVADLPSSLKQYKDMLRGRFMLVKKAELIEIECVVRGYLEGSGWREYEATGSICGIPLPSGYRKADKLAEPIFTPAIKAQSGHDENISLAKVSQAIGANVTQTLKELSIRLYQKAQEKAESVGLIIADTKFEFGLLDGSIILIDEVLTPDSSRFWPMDQYSPGKAQASFDKQFVREYLEKIGWNKEPPIPELPPDIVTKTAEKYIEAYRRITGKTDIVL